MRTCCSLVYANTKNTQLGFSLFEYCFFLFVFFHNITTTAVLNTLEYKGRQLLDVSNRQWNNGSTS